MVGQAIILNSVHKSLEDELTLHKSFHNTFVNLKMRFSSICQSVQLVTFMALGDLKPEAFVNTVVYGAEMCDLVLDLNNMHCEFTAGKILGIFLQLNLCE
ncbi:uncharacterized protein VP01_835g7 [Puccinia sorghi]|uniref:Uncharacterized protein n=1 Tax=Puccinia sorghi TaxID=27349 RepID=A0A0L6UBP0_9BASI|nr:uncharacterized protein VP01_835g7 [Puccinia sorghi]